MTNHRIFGAKAFEQMFEVAGVYLTGLLSFLAYVALNWLLVQHVDLHAYGDYHLSLRWAFLGSNLLMLGQPLAIRCFLSDALRQKNRCQAKSLLSMMLRKVRSVSLLTAVLLLLRQCLLICAPQSSWLNFLAHPCVLIVSALPVMVGINILVPILDVLHFFRLSRVTQNLLQQLYFAVILFVPSYWGMHLSVGMMVVIFLLSQILVLVSVMLVVRRPLHAIWQHHATVVLPEGKIREVAMQGFLSNLSYQVILYLSVLSIGFLSSEPDIVGHFSAVMVLVNVYTILSESMGALLSQRLLELYRQENTQRLCTLFWLCFAINAVGTALLWYLGCCFADPLLYAFGEEFLVSSAVMHFALSINALLNLLQPLWSLVEYIEPRLHAKLSMLQLFLTVLALWILVPMYGIYGAVVGDVLPEFMVLTYLVLVVRTPLLIKIFTIRLPVIKGAMT